MQFETNQLLIRPSQIEDASFVLNLLNTPSWLKNIGDRNIHTLKDAQNYILTKHLPHFESHGYGNFVVILKKNIQTIGTVGLYNRPGLTIPDIGFAFLPNFERQGYGFESASVIRDAGFNQFGLQKISAITLSANIASVHLLQKLGLKYINDIKLQEGNETLSYYELNKQDWLSLK
jgi:[ribosomal protein S5]-alanine N-acetyltransferase